MSLTIENSSFKIDRFISFRFFSFQRWKLKLNSRTSCWPIEYKLNYFTWQTDSRNNRRTSRSIYLMSKEKSKSESGIHLAHHLFCSVFFCSHHISPLSVNGLFSRDIIHSSFFFLFNHHHTKWSSRQKFETRYDKLRW